MSECINQADSSKYPVHGTRMTMKSGPNPCTQTRVLYSINPNECIHTLLYNYRSIDTIDCVQVTRLKIDHNPFAKGFRNNTRGIAGFSSNATGDTSSRRVVVPMTPPDVRRRRRQYQFVCQRGPVTMETLFASWLRRFYYRQYHYRLAPLTTQIHPSL